jgi:hypothetical protein
MWSVLNNCIPKSCGSGHKGNMMGAGSSFPYERTDRRFCLGVERSPDVSAKDKVMRKRQECQNCSCNSVTDAVPTTIQVLDTTAIRSNVVLKTGETTLPSVFQTLVVDLIRDNLL